MAPMTTPRLSPNCPSPSDTPPNRYGALVGSELLLLPPITVAPEPKSSDSKDWTIRLDDLHSDLEDLDDYDNDNDNDNDWDDHHDYSHAFASPPLLARLSRRVCAHSRRCAWWTYNHRDSWCNPRPSPRLLVLFSLPVLAVLAIVLSHHASSSPRAPLTLLISIDGFRPDYLTSRPHLTPNLHALLSSPSRPAVRAAHLRPSFPTITFPNHYTLVTGQRPSQHGIVSNAFFDPVLNTSFLYTSPQSNADPRFWANAEPLWITAERQGLATGVVHWPGNEAPHARPDAAAPAPANLWPSLWMRYKNWSPAHRVALVMHWLDPRNVSGRVPAALVPDEDKGEDWPGWPGRKRAQWPAYPPPVTSAGLSLVALYIPQVDQAGHKAGPDSEAVNQAIAQVDAALGDLFAFLKHMGWWDSTNVVVVSDHGMAKAGEDDHEEVVPAEGARSKYRISLREALGLFHDVVVVRDRWPIVMLDPVDPQDTMPILHQLQQTSTRLRFRAFHRDALPPELQYDNNLRIPPLVVIPDNDLQFEDLPNEPLPTGMHGYDLTTDTLGEMRAMFLASGPAFARAAASSGSVRTDTSADQVGTVEREVPAFDNVEVYGILCKTLGIRPEANAGSGVDWFP